MVLSPLRRGPQGRRGKGERSISRGRSPKPIAGATFILIHKHPPDPAAATAALKSFAWAYAKGGQMAEQLDYIPMPASVVAAIEKMCATSIKDGGDNSI
jgi:phosphate transport system substrate-binding protein